VTRLLLRALIASLIVPMLLVPPAILPGRRLERRDGAGPVLDDALERARAALVEVQAARHRLEPHLQALHLERVACHFDDEVVNDLVVQRVELFALGPALRVPLVQVRLDVQRLDQRVRVEQHLQERPQQRPHPADRSAVRFVERVLAEREVRRGRLRRAHAAVLLEQPRAHAFRIDELLELHVRELADLFLGVVDAALLADARADLLHDLLDVEAVGADGKIRHELTLSGLPGDRRPGPDACAWSGTPAPR
jgi:hypothetical protein